MEQNVKIAIVIVTYKRQELLTKLLNSIVEIRKYIWETIIVDNENSKQTENIAARYNNTFHLNIKYLAQEKNLGGAGGFRVGIEQGYKDKADWLWIMDDDVKVISKNAGRILELVSKEKAIMGNRLDYYGNQIMTPFKLSNYFGIANPIKRNPFKTKDIASSNMICFEGGLISTSLIQEIGIPDSRFFIYWDDITYGYLLSKYASIARVNIDIVQRTRDTKSIKKGNFTIDKLNDEKKYYMIRNRGLLANYMKIYGDYHGVFFTIGTLYCICRECLRIMMTHEKFSAIKYLIKGFVDSRKIINNKKWHPENQIRKYDE